MKQLFNITFKYLVSMYCSLGASTLVAQSKTDEYLVNTNASNIVMLQNHLQLGTNKNPNGNEFSANSFYFTKNQQPWYPVMGEMHFSRIPQTEWEASILKMKACGINIIATYIFWIYHEEKEGEWNWSNNNDVALFLKLCAKHNMNVWLRIGPWCHGEVRNGGFPDWLLTKCKTRTNDTTYLRLVGSFFYKIHQQVQQYYFKNGGTIIGVQIENEYRFNNPKGLEHILTLKNMAKAIGIDVPYYSATGWPGANIQQTELIPVYGAYPEAPWDKRTAQLPLSNNYLFDTLRVDQTIGADLLGNSPKDTTNFKGFRYPYATAEMGAGIQITYHRRPIIKPIDVAALAYTKAGSGANLMGYYMFHGGSNAIGKYSTLQESKATKYPNDYPIISYDFQAPIQEWGQLNESYHHFKQIHYFFNHFGNQLATYNTFFPNQKASKPTDTTSLRWSVRANATSGFIFISNYQRLANMVSHNQVQFQIQQAHSILKVPEKPIVIPANTMCILPYNMSIESAILQYATAQPYCTLNTKKGKVYVFATIEGMKPSFVFQSQSIKQIVTAENKILTSKNAISVQETNFFTITFTNGKSVSCLLLSAKDALHSYKATFNQFDYLITSEADLTIYPQKISIHSTNQPKFSCTVFPAKNDLQFSNVLVEKNTKLSPLQTVYTLNCKPEKTTVEWKPFSPIHLPIDTSLEKGLPLYKKSLTNIKDAAYYTISVPASVTNSRYPYFLKINYEGDTEATFFNNQLIADHFYNGSSAIIPLKRWLNKTSSHQLQILITALTDQAKIYFEKGIREPLEGKKIAHLKNVELIPVYETTMSNF